jgi:hypothetical protein
VTKGNTAGDVGEIIIITFIQILLNMGPKCEEKKQRRRKWKVVRVVEGEE